MFSIKQVQRVAIFDIAFLNLDRNDGNLLVKENKSKPNPLDITRRLIPSKFAEGILNKIDQKLKLSDRKETNISNEEFLAISKYTEHNDGYDEKKWYNNTLNIF